MKKIIISLVAVLVASTLCNAQIKVPVQTDTLWIKSMQYHFEDIRPENWPFKYILRKAQSFTFGEQEFLIKDSYKFTDYIEFSLQSNGKCSTLKLTYLENNIQIEYAGYLLVCTKSYFEGNNPKANISRPSNIKILALLDGRTVDKAGMKKPRVEINSTGVVAIDIWVDQYGKVIKAIPGGYGTTTTEKELWIAARNAALETGFNMKADAPELQKGQIKYYFYDVENATNPSDIEKKNEESVPFRLVQQKPSFSNYSGAPFKEGAQSCFQIG